jgi:4-hydroxybenzoate polyprenyltransferase
MAVICHRRWDPLVSRSSAAVLTGLARGCHPGPTFVVTLVAALLTVSAGAALSTTAAVAVTVLTGQLSIGWSNDWLDAARDRTRHDKPTAVGVISPPTLRTAAVVALAGTVLLSVLLSWPHGLWQLVLVAAGWTYNLGVKATVASPIPYAVGFGALPVYALTTAGVAVAWWVPVCGALLGVAGHFANAAPDVELDRSHGVDGLPQRLGARRSLGLALAVLAAAGVVLVGQLEVSGRSAAAAAAVVVLPLVLGLWTLTRGQSTRRTFRLVMVAAVLDVVLLVVAS